MTTKRTQSKPRYAPVGAVVFSGYWNQSYAVLSHNTDDNAMCSDGTVTVRWQDGRVTTHCTAMDWRHDRILTKN